MQKKYFKVSSGLLFLLCLFNFVPTVNAATAYSVGTLYGSGTNHAGDDFRTNVINASNEYAKISGMDSNRNTQPTYTFMKKTSVLGNSKVFFINGHANNHYITLGYTNTTEGRTGISVYNDGWTGNGYKTAGLNSRSMSGTTLITFVGCETAGYVGDADNLTDKALSKGAKAVVGWYHSIHSRVYNGPQWLSSYNSGLGGGLTIMNSIYRAKVAWPSSDLSDFYATRGNTNLTIGTSTQPLMVNNESNQKLLTANSVRSHNDALQLISSDYKIIDTSIMDFEPVDKEIIDEDLSSYTTLFESIISKIKLKDASFDPSDYKVTYHLANAENGYGDIYFTYYIDGKIETNKVYIATFENYKITDIVLGGVTIDNLDNVKTNVKTLLNNKISLFENEKVSKLLEKDSNLFKKSKLQTNQVDVLDVNKKIKISSLNGNVIESSELYYYDYNTQELKYILKTVKNINGLYDADGIEIII